MPQANIFFIALPVKMGIAIIMLHMVMPYLPVCFRWNVHPAVRLSESGD